MNNLKSAFEETCADKILSTIPDSPDYVFSKAFERKMARLIRSSRAENRQPITAKRVITYIATAILAAAILILTACAARYIYENFIMEQHETHTRASFSDSEDAPKYIEEVYAIDIPDGFETVYDDSEDSGSAVCMNYFYIKNDMEKLQ